MALALGDKNSTAVFASPTSKEVGHPIRFLTGAVRITRGNTCDATLARNERIGFAQLASQRLVVVIALDLLLGTLGDKGGCF